MTDKWQAGKTYSPGAFVRPATDPAPIVGKLTNGDFESGSSGWDLDAGLAVVTTDHYSGTQSLSLPGQGDNVFTQKVGLNQSKVTVRPGQAISAQAQIQQGASIAGAAGGWVFIRYFGSNDLQVGNDVEGNHVTSGSGGQWQPSKVSDSAPANAAYARVGTVLFNASDTHTVWADAVTVNSTYTVPPSGLTFEAVQAAPAKSGNAEPVWPTAIGATVVDGGVTWEAVVASQVVWQASPLMQSGDTEPAWPTVSGATVRDGTIDWTAKPFQITDVHCPQSAIVAIAGAKVFAADGDVIRFCATINPNDWTAVDDAGFLPYGLNDFGSNPVAAMGLYRSNLVAFNAEGLQMWQVDPDPANMAHLDSLPISSTQPKALAPVANDLLFLSPEGVRSLGIAGASTNLEAGGVGMPIDPLVKAAVDDAVANGAKIVSAYDPGRGQYFLAINASATAVQVHNVDLNGAANAGETSSVGVTLSGFSETDVLTITLPTGRAFTAWNNQSTQAWSCIFNVTDDAGVTTQYLANTAGSATAAAAFSAAQANLPIILRGSMSYTFWLPDGNPNDNIGGLSVSAELPVPSTVFVFTRNGKVAGWSRYLLPFSVDAFCQSGDDLYIRSGDDLLKVDDAVISDYAGDPRELPFDGVIQWPWLSFGSPATKQLQGVEVVGDGLPTIEIGYDESDQSAFTPAYDIPVADTLPGQMIPLPLMAPSLSARITYKGSLQSAPWRLQAVSLYMQGQRMTA